MRSMKCVSEVMGLPVMLAQSGKRQGAVKAFCFCLDQKRVEGLWITREGFRTGHAFYPAQSIKVIGDKSVVVMGEPVKGPPRTPLPDRVITGAGERVGRVSDVCFDEDTLRVTRLEISFGFFEDWTVRRQWVDLFSRQGAQVVVSIQED